MERKDLQAEVAYYDQTAEMWFWSPDGVGGYWYDSLEELEEQHGEQDLVKHVSEILDY